MNGSEAGWAQRAIFPYFNEEHKLFRASVKEFCQREIAPRSQQWEENHQYPKEIFRQAGALGLFGIRSDPEWGGAGMDWWASAAAYDALRYTDFPSLNIGFMVQADLTIPMIEHLGTREQKQEFLAPAITADRIAALGISEPGCGSDVAGIQCSARESGGDLIVNGQKLWITNGAIADFIVLAVRTAENRHKGISVVLFPTDVKGFSVGRRVGKVGHVASDTAHLFFDECRIPERFVLGERNHGFYYVVRNFQGERLALTLLVLAFMDRAIELAVDYARDRKAFGVPLIEKQVWKHRFAEHVANIEAARWLTYRALDLVNRNEKPESAVAMAKLVVCDLAQKVTYDSMQVFGGFGYTTEYPIGRIWRDMRLYTIGGGTSEIMKEIIAKHQGY
jgi:citronellyl-CoA dehydrogenase